MPVLPFIHRYLISHMKRIFTSLMLWAALTTGCTQQSEHGHQEDGTHTHEDGTTHEDHPAAPEQEEFAVSPDSAATGSPATDSVHTHADGKAHSH